MRYTDLSTMMVAGIAVLAVGALGGPAMAQSGEPRFDRLHVYGDSSSDNGNLYAEYGGQMHFSFGLFYPTGSFSNGPVWGDYLVQSGLALVEENHAYAGAMTGAYGEPSRMGAEIGLLPTGLLSQIEAFPGPFGENDIVGIWAGFNDYLFGAQYGTDNAPATVVGNIAAAVARLDALGARHIMVFNLPDMSRMPLAAFVDRATTVKLGTASAVHNALLVSALSRLRVQLDAEIVLVDVFSAMSQIVGYPERFGFTNATDSCILILADGETAIPNPYSPCYDGDNGTPANPFDDPLNPAGFVFWDLLHPATDTHRLIAGFVEATLASQAFGTATYGSNATSSAGGNGVVYMCADPADGDWCY